MSRRKKSFPFFLWHRRLGLVALALVFILSVTGIMLNHTESLKLDESTIESELLLDWYGVNPQGEPLNYSIENIWISQWNQQVFYNGETLFTHNERLLGIAQLDDMIALALGRDILLIDTGGEVIELMKNTTASPIVQIGVSDSKVALIDKEKNFYLSDLQLSRWEKQPQEKQQWEEQSRVNTQWSNLSAPSNAQLTQLKQAYRGQGLNLERVILDLHSGRIFNDSWGVYIMDASAILMILLGISGFWVWWSRKLKQRKKKHYKKHHKT